MNNKEIWMTFVEYDASYGIRNNLKLLGVFDNKSDAIKAICRTKKCQFNRLLSKKQRVYNEYFNLENNDDICYRSETVEHHIIWFVVVKKHTNIYYKPKE